MLLHHSNHVFYDVGSSEEISRVRFDVNENYMRCRTDAGVYLGFLTKWGRGVQTWCPYDLCRHFRSFLYHNESFFLAGGGVTCIFVIPNVCLKTVNMIKKNLCTSLRCTCHFLSWAALQFGKNAAFPRVRHSSNLPSALCIPASFPLMEHQDGKEDPHEPQHGELLLFKGRIAKGEYVNWGRKIFGCDVFLHARV